MFDMPLMGRDGTTNHHWGIPNYASIPALCKVTESISVAHHCRKRYFLPRLYDVRYLHDAIYSSLTREKLVNGQLIGYYGHSARKRHLGHLGWEEGIIAPCSFKLSHEKGLEFFPNYPVSRLVALDIHDRVVTFTLEVLDTPHGRQVARLVAQNVGGWSWSGWGDEHEQTEAGKILKIKHFHGFDYVTRPHFIPEHRRLALALDYEPIMIGHPPA